jgi:hypothetical protein
MVVGQAAGKGCFLTVLFIIIMVAALFMLSYLLIFMNPNLDKLKDQSHCSLTGHSFTNLYDGPVTRNGGGWVLQVQAVSGPRLGLKDLIVAVRSPATGIDPSQVWKLNVKGTGNRSPDLSYEGQSSRWYLRAFNSTAVPLRFADGTVPKALNDTTAPGLRDDQLPTVEGTVLFYKDTDLDGNLSLHDKVMVYKDVNADGKVELRPGTLIELQTVDGKLVASAKLM